jgi:hypothetical protein
MGFVSRILEAGNYAGQKFMGRYREAQKLDCSGDWVEGLVFGAAARYPVDFLAKLWEGPHQATRQDIDKV